MKPRWNIYYRGSLSSCNYACPYCPFAKTSNTRPELLRDQHEVERFVDWVETQADGDIAVLFTPWGEALGHRYYRQALVKLSQLSQVRQVAIQTNLSAPLQDLESACRQSLALWTTYHPGETSRDRFLQRCRFLDGAGLRYSVGVVGMKEHLQELEALRAQLRPEVYLWVNAYKRVADYYGAEELARIRAVDPYFDLNTRRYPSAGKACAAGETHFTVDGGGDIRRCHFIGQVMGNLYAGDLQQVLRPRLCSAESCGCYIGYIHQPELELHRLYGEDLLARIPRSWPQLLPI